MPSVPPERDLNLEVAGVLYDMAAVHRGSEHRSTAYKRAAGVVLALEEQLDAMVAERSLRELRHIGPACERIILEYLEHGKSASVERAIDESGRRSEIEAARAPRHHFMSRAIVLSVLRATLPGVIELRDYRGDLQVHSVWSDGGDSIADLAEAAARRGHAFLGVSDHSQGLRIARGMSMEDAARQHREIDEINQLWHGRFRVFRAIEANIPAEGGVDLTTEEVARFEIVLAAAHSKLRGNEDQTERMLATVRHPGVHVLAHPRGRTFSRRGLLARWDEVFAEAGARGVAIELDGDPNRQDLDWSLAVQALGAGCLFALDSDAHSGDELVYSEYAVAHARRAGIPADRVINTWSAEKLAAWSEEKSHVPRRSRVGRASR